MSDIFSEVDEGIRQQKLESWWKRWRPFIYGAIAVLVGSVAINEFVLKPQAAASRAARALELENAVKALEDGRYEEAQAAFKAIVDSGSKLAPLAAHYLAETQIEGGGDAAAAADTLAAIGGTEGGPYERLALLKAAYFRADTASLPELEVALGSLVTEESALGALARELIAAKAFETGDIARARTEYSRLKFDAAAPQGVIDRAEMALEAIPLAPEATPETTAPEEAPADEAPVEPQEPGQ
ncbi:MAG: tetratricopeptide repeat protein [Hyphomonas sp.]